MLINVFIVYVAISDENECDREPCDVNADCENTDGSFICRCLPGYVGSGRICTGKNNTPSNI